MLAAAFVIACRHEYDELIFKDDVGLAGNAGAAGSDGTAECEALEVVCNGACVAADEDVRCGGCDNDCTAQGLVCLASACGCSTNAQCGLQGTCSQDAGRCECGGAQCRAGERCERSGSRVSCTCNGGPACGVGEKCCQSPAGCNATCQR